MTPSLDYYKRFRRLMQSMATVCGVTRLDDDAAEDFLKQLKGIELDVLEKAISNVVKEKAGSFHSLPAVGEILAEVKAVQADMGRRQNTVPCWCEKCCNSGLVLVRDGKGQAMAYRCTCPNGQRQDRHIKSFSEVESKFTPTEGWVPAKLPLVTLQMIENMPPDQQYPEGCEVAKVCDVCTGPYEVRHERPISGAELKEFHAHPTRPQLCEKCFVQLGVERGMWTKN